MNDSYDNSWTGATEENVRSADSTALILACLNTMEVHRPEQITDFSDAKTVQNAATGQWNLPSDDLLAADLRATFLFRCRTGLFVNMYVASLEFCLMSLQTTILLLVLVNERTLPSRGIPRDYTSWFGDTKPKIHSARLLIDQLQRDKSVPISLDGRLRGLYLLLTKHSTGYATSYLREQLEGLSVHIAGFQDCPLPHPKLLTPSSSGSYLLQGLAERGFGSVALFFSCKVSGKCFLQQDQTLALHLQPEVHFLYKTLTPHKHLCVSAHAPPKSHSSVTSWIWWKRLSGIFRGVGKHDATLIFIDANASIGQAEPWIGAVAEEVFDVGGPALTSAISGI